MNPSEPVTILAIGAHPDDIEFGCGAVLALEAQRGAAVHLVVCSRGESGSNGVPEERTLEAENAARHLGATLEFLDLGGDAHMEQRSVHALALAAVIRRVRPQILLAPTLVENQHPDHAVVGKLARDAARIARYGGVAELKSLAPHSIRQLFYFAITADAEPRDAAPVMIAVTSEFAIQAWTASMEAHASQLKTRNYVDLQLSRARLNGSRCGASHAALLFPNDPLVFDSLGAVGRGARRF